MFESGNDLSVIVFVDVQVVVDEAQLTLSRSVPLADQVLPEF
jgi:hypothetical protein